MRRLLVTGASGFVGRHLVERARRDYDVTGTGRGARPDWLPADVAWLDIDLRDPAALAGLDRQWWGIIHLAAETLPAKFGSLAPVFDSLAMLLSLTEHLESGRLLFVSSCHVYAPGGDTKTEDSPTAPDGRYGLTKLLCETAALSARKLDPRVARPFNHIGVGMRPELAVPSIVRRVLEAPKGAPIEMLGLDSVRDFLDVEDIVEAYLAILAVEAPTQRIFNVCSGRGVMISQVVDGIVRAAGRRNRAIFKEKPTSADDTPRLVGDPGLLKESTGWKASVPLEESIERLVTSASARGIASA